MKKFLFFLILIFPVLAYGQNIRIQQMRSTGEPAGKIIVTDGSGSFEFGDNSYAADSTAIQNHIDNDNDTDPTNELIDSIRTDSVYLIIYEGGSATGDSINLDSMFYENAKIDSMTMSGDTLNIFQGGDTLAYSFVLDLSNYWSKTEITEADTTRWGTLQTATQTSVADTAGYYDNDNVEQVLREIGQDIETAGDNWGSQTVVSDNTISGTGITGDELKVDTTVIATKNDVNDVGDNWGSQTVVSDNTLTGTGVTGNELKVDTTLIPTIDKVRLEISDSVSTVSGGGITALTGEVTASGSGSVAATVADNVIDYGNVDETLKSSTTNNTLTWDISANGIILCTPSSGTVSFSNYQVNKSITVVLTLSGGATVSWPAEAKIIDGSATLGDGTFYVYVHCISSTIFTVSITKEAS